MDEPENAEQRRGLDVTLCREDTGLLLHKEGGNEEQVGLSRETNG